MEEEAVYQIYEVRCNDVLEQEGVRFAAIINSEGKLTAGGFKKGITPLEGDEEKLHDFMKYAAKISLQEEYDASLGALNYIAARRDKIILISFPFPVSRHILLVSAEPGLDIENLAKVVVTIFGDSSHATERGLSESFPGV